MAGVAVVVGLGIGMFGRPSATPPMSATAVTFGEEIEVHVAGWVMEPGVVLVRTGSIVADAIQAAGGLRSGASTDAINLASPVYQGDQIVVPGPQLETQTEMGGLLSLNSATATDFETLPGVGPVLAERIVSYRDQNGRFQSVEDLLEVPGIGEAKLASIRDLVRP